MGSIVTHNKTPYERGFVIRKPPNYRLRLLSSFHVFMSNALSALSLST